MNLDLSYASIILIKLYLSKKDNIMNIQNPKKFQTEHEATKISLKGIQHQFFRTQLILIISLAVILGLAGTFINLQFETEKRDRNLQNVATAIARSPILTENHTYEKKDTLVLQEYLDSLKETLDDIDVISIVDNNHIRVYHSTHTLIGTTYDGTIPKFELSSENYYTVDETGPSGSQRRAYAAIYNEDGEYIGFVMAIMLMKNIKLENLQMFSIFLLITIVAILIELILSAELSEKIKKSLMGYEPDVFTTMYKLRDSILETLDEGILAVNKHGVIEFANHAAIRMLKNKDTSDWIGKDIEIIGDTILSNTIRHGKREFHVNISKNDIILDQVPVLENEQRVGTIAILHNRAEYTKLMEDLSGTRYLVDSMRANNHDFTNKLHVILGLIQMEMYDQATAYIQNITMVQKKNISSIMNAIQDPAVAALLIGKLARASELNIKFILREGCYYSSTDMHLPSEMLITVIGNLLNNAFEAMNEEHPFETPKELMFGIYSRPGAVLITVDDTGTGISSKDIPHIFENGYSTKGECRGTGLYQAKNMVENFGGTITVESQEGIGTSFSISFTQK